MGQATVHDLPDWIEDYGNLLNSHDVSALLADDVKLNAEQEVQQSLLLKVMTEGHVATRLKGQDQGTIAELYKTMARYYHHMRKGSGVMLCGHLGSAHCLKAGDEQGDLECQALLEHGRRFEP